jgi:hypothetical protein
MLAEMEVTVVSAIAQIDQASEEIIYALARRIIVYRLGEFDRVCESANRICDRYELCPNGRFA